MEENNQDVSNQDIDVGQPEIDQTPELEPVIICQFTFHPATGDITFEVAKDIDLIDLVKCKRALVEQIEDAEMNLWNLLHRGQQQMLTKQNALLEGWRELLKDSLLRKSELLEKASKNKLVKVNK